MVSRCYLVALFVPLALLAGCTKQERRPKRPVNAILVTLDTTRPEALGAFGGRTGVTPYLDEIAGESVIFESARTVAPLTLPAHASMMTGLYPPRHGVRDNGLAPLPSAARTLAEVARDAGFKTAAFVSSTALDEAFGLDQGFDVYDQPARASEQTDSHFQERSALETTRAVWRYLDRRDKSRPFFLWIHLFDPHVPYAPADMFLEQAGGEKYLGEVAAVDSAIGRMIEGLRRQDVMGRTLLIVAADHGESLGEHDEQTHGAFAYDATLRVPLFVRYPDLWHGGERVSANVSVADVFPTLVDALGLGTPGEIDGISLYRNAVPEDRGVYFESYSGWLNYGWSPLAGWVDAKGKYIHSSAPEFYDLALDPREQHEMLAEATQDDIARYVEALRRLALRPTLASEPVAFEESLLRELRQLGYGAMGQQPPDLPAPLDPSDRASPRERRAELQPFLFANALAGERQYEQAVPLLEDIVQDNPEHALATDVLGFALLQLGRTKEARPYFERRLTFGPQRTDTRINLAAALELEGERERALALYREALAIDPSNPKALAAVARVQAELEAGRKR